MFESLKPSLHYLEAKDQADVEKAFRFAEQAHTGQKRASGEPFISHPVAVANILAQMHMDAQSIQAGILHDVVEDTDVKLDEIVSIFGISVANLVDGVTKLTQVKFDTKQEAQAENFRKMLLAMVKDIRVIVVKLADRLHNMQTVHHLSIERKKRIARETLDIYAHIANRLGMHDVSLMLENLGFKALYPMRYQILHALIEKMQGNHDDFIQNIEHVLHGYLERHDVRVLALFGREKHVYSVYRKMRDKNLSFIEISDVFAIRIIVSTLDDCYRTLGVVHQAYKPIPERFKDYIALPKPNGYQSLHTVLFGPNGTPVEVQIRTEKMDRISTNGLAAHWSYKRGDIEGAQEDGQHHDWLARLLDIQRTSENSIDFIENVKVDLYPEAIYVFTPKGSIIELPNHATAMDFAYAIHSDVGNSCVAAKVDRRLVPLSTALYNGNAIEIITSKHAHPNPAWLNVVVTAKAKSCIRKYLNHQKEKQLITIGNQVLEVALKRTGHQELSSAERDLLSMKLGAESFEQVLVRLGQGDVSPAKLLEAMHTIDDDLALSLKFQEPLANAHPYELTGAEGAVIVYGDCCYPIPGDPIIGVRASDGEYIKVHRQSCQKLKQIQKKHMERCLPMHWGDETLNTYLTEVAIVVMNQRGVLANIALVIAEMEGNIADITSKKNDGRYSSLIMLVEVQSNRHLAKILRSVSRSPAVVKVERSYE